MRGNLEFRNMFIESSSSCNDLGDSIYEEQCEDIEERGSVGSPVYFIYEMDSTALNKRLEFSLPPPGSGTTDWKKKCVEEWESKDIMFWIISVAHENNLNSDDINISQFNNLDGRTLFTMSEEDFVMREDKFGKKLFCALQQLKYKLQKTGLNAAKDSDNEASLKQWKDAGYKSSSEHSVYLVSELYPTAVNKRLEFSIPQSGVVTTDWKRKSVKQWDSKDIMFWIISVANENNLNTDDINIPQFNDLDGEMLSNMSESDFLSRENKYGKMFFTALQQMKCKLQESEESKMETKLSHQNETGKKNRGRPRKLNCEDRKRDRKSAKKIGRLWEFIRDLLLNRDYCPSLICWENYDEGVFRFINSKGVAELWGKLKNNKNMTYDKLSRGMRHYYKKKVFQSVEKRLVYQFGSEATGWQTSNPNFKL